VTDWFAAYELFHTITIPLLIFEVIWISAPLILLMYIFGKPVNWRHLRTSFMAVRVIIIASLALVAGLIKALELIAPLIHAKIHSMLDAYVYGFASTAGPVASVAIIILAALSSLLVPTLLIWYSLSIISSKSCVTK
jgi:hypothetical protein